jgi:hypothetical protein
MSMLDFMTSGAPLPAGTTPSSRATTSSLPDWYNNYAANLLSPQSRQQPQQPQQQQQQPYQAYQQYQQQQYQQQPYQQQQQGGQAQQQPYSPYATPEWERAALQGLSQPYPQAPTQSPFAAPQPMPQQPMPQQPMPQQQNRNTNFQQLPGYPTQPDVTPYNNGYPNIPKPMYPPPPYVPNPPVPELMPDPTMPQGNFGTNISGQPVNPYNNGIKLSDRPTFGYGNGVVYERGPNFGNDDPMVPMPTRGPVAMARGGLFAVNRPASRVSSMAVKQGRI